METFLLLVTQTFKWLGKHGRLWDGDRLQGARATSGWVGLEEPGTAWTQTRVFGLCRAATSAVKILCKERRKSKRKQQTGNKCVLF